MPPIRPLSRRSFLRRTAASALLLGAPACGADEETLDTTDAGDDANDAVNGSGDVTPDSDTADADRSDDAGDSGAAIDPELAAVLTKGPWLYLGADGGVTLWFEVAGAWSDALEVWAKVDEGDWARWPVTPEPSEEVPYRWPPSEALLTDHPDLPGTYTVVAAASGALPGGVQVVWEVRSPNGGVAARGSLGTIAERGPFTFAWFSDTMIPNSAAVSALVAQQEFQLVIHGGDIQYRSAIVDTWNGMFATFGPLMRRAPMHFIIGNHEFEAGDESGDLADVEYDTTYRRLFHRQGEVGTQEYHAFTRGGVRFILLNSEDRYFSGQGAQLAWLRDELAAASASPDVRATVVGFHRPFWTMSSSRPSMEDREVLHPLFVEHRVALVLTGHNHCYERFEVDGVTYVVDGGGGALLYSPDENYDAIEQLRPGEGAYRVTAANGYGATFVTVNDDGTLEVVRRGVAGEETDRYVITPRA